MLQVAVCRLSSLWPEAAIEVVTDQPELLARYCPNAKPVAVRGRRIWFKQGNLFGPWFYRLLPRRIAHHFWGIERLIRQGWPSLAQKMIQLRPKYQAVDIANMRAFLEALSRADLLVVSGGGDINDTFMTYAITLLDELQMAHRRGTPTVLFGQGIGPIQNQRLRKRAMAALPSVDLICIRERRAGPSLLDSLGVPPTRVVVTGDDAIEMAYKARPHKLGTAIGVNLRVAPYSEVNNGSSEIVRDVLHDTAQNYGAPLISLPISFHHSDSDVKTTRHLLNLHDDSSDGGQNLDNPLKIIERVGRCRVVVTGSYHPAVFALAQGIPVVSLAKSSYYIDKHLGLADLFGTGCEIVSLDDERLREKLAKAIDRAWRAAEQVRPQLLEAAARQVEAGLAGYQSFSELVGSQGGTE